MRKSEEGQNHIFKNNSNLRIFMQVGFFFSSSNHLSVAQSDVSRERKLGVGQVSIPIAGYSSHAWRRAPAWAHYGSSSKRCIHMARW